MNTSRVILAGVIVIGVVSIFGAAIASEPRPTEPKAVMVEAAALDDSLGLPESSGIRVERPPLESADAETGLRFEDCNSNGVDDPDDIAAGTSGDCNSNGIPDDCDIAAGTSDDCNNNASPDSCEVSVQDCNASGAPDDCDVTAGTSQDCNSNVIPDECEIAGLDCNASGYPDDCDIAAGTSTDCNDNETPDECELDGNDCNGNAAPDECDISLGTSEDCNASGTPDECELADNDCNGNTTPDECDLASAASSDCQGNGIPDECDLAAGTGQDCNTNGVPDDCDLAAGTSLDCQPNAVPDECDIAGATSTDNDLDTVPDDCETSLAVTAHTPSGVVDHPVRYLDVTFGDTILADTFAAEDLELRDPHGAPVPVEEPEHLGENTWRIAFPMVSSNGMYHLHVGPHISNPFWNEMDQDGDGIRGEDVEDVYDAAFEIDSVVDEVVFTADTWIGCEELTYDGDDIVVNGCTLTVDCKHTFNSLSVINSGAVTHTAVASCAECRLDVVVLTDVDVESGSRIHANQRGYGSEQGPGAGGSEYSSGGGGSHGGNGGNGASSPGGSAYDSLTEPYQAGSGGGRSTGWNYAGGAGGGVIRLDVGGALSMAGTLSAVGGNGVSNRGGGGAGGSIWITAGTLVGDGVISADGGVGGSSYGGGGAGGRIAVHADTYQYTGTFAACGGSSPSQAGGAGTVYVKETGEATGYLTLDNCGRSGASTPASDPDMLIDLVVTRGAWLDWTGVSLAVGTVTLDAGKMYGPADFSCDTLDASNASSLYLQGTTTVDDVLLGADCQVLVRPGHAGFELHVTGDLTMDASAAISGNSMGYGSEQGPGAGGSEYSSGGGGSHGGNGGNGSSAAGGFAYDSLTQPSQPGSGGGRSTGWNYIGGSGGAAIRLIVDGTFAAEGSLSSDATAGASSRGGGGAGGSIWITAGTLTGAGQMTANGGAGGTSYGGGGAGGRIAVYADTYDYTGAFTACGGSSPSQAGGAGTVYVQETGEATGYLTLDNCGRGGASTPVDGVDTLIDLVVDDGAWIDWIGASLVVGTVTLDAGKIYGPPVFTADTIDASNGSSLYLQGTTTVGDVSLGTDCQVLVRPGHTGLLLHTTGDLTMDASAVISGDGVGYSSEQGPGAGGSEYSSGGGGSHGGNGGNGASSAGGSAYDSLTEPSQPGSGGGRSTGWNYIGGSGGAAIRLIVDGTFAAEGTLSSDATAGASSRGGGGAGGSIWITAGTLTGAGQMAANGGAGGTSYGGGGAGGRIAVYADTYEYTGTFAACGGSSPSQAGGAGTVYVKESPAAVGYLTLGNCGRSGASTPVSEPDTLSDLTVLAGAAIDMIGASLDVDVITLDAGVAHLPAVVAAQLLSIENGSAAYLHGTVTTGSASLGADCRVYIRPGQTAFELIVLGDFPVDPTAVISGDGGGYGPQSGPAAGASSCYGGGGGGHGAWGGNGSGAAGGAPYDSLREPVEAGSGGGRATCYNYNGGAGGGAIRLSIGGMFTLDGTLTSDGVDGASGRGGGGAGGSVWVTADTLVGGGGISASGGGAGSSGGGGAGGRIAIYYGTNSLTGDVIACAGGGEAYGGAGTVYTKAEGEAHGDLRIDGCGTDGALTLLDDSGPFADVITANHTRVDVTVAEVAAASWTASDQAVVAAQELDLGGLEVRTGSRIEARSSVRSLTLVAAGDVTVESGASITGTTRGYGASSGPGAGVSSCYGGGGGGYGGAGGGAGGLPYGSLEMPVDPGSGGGTATCYNYAGGSGGAALRLIVNGTLTVDGELTANGGDGASSRGGGGAGGSIYLTTSVLTGAGTVSADGGSTGSSGGGGGGGRIAVYYNDMSGFAVERITVDGGTGAAAGEVGTIYFAVLEAPHVVSHAPAGPVNHPVDYLDIAFNVAINGSTFTTDDVALVGPDEAAVPLTAAPTVQSNGLWRVEFDAQADEGEYTARIGPHIEGPAGHEMDQNLDATPGEDPEDVYIATFTIDVTPPEGVDHAPAGDVHYLADHVDVTFTERVAVDACSNGAILLVGPNGEIPLDSSEPIGDNVWRFNFAPVNSNGLYELVLPTCVRDLAGNPLVEAYAAAFVLALPDLAVTAVGGSPEGGTIAGTTVDWTVTNRGTYAAAGSWMERVYLSDDAEVGDDALVASYTWTGPLAAGAVYERSFEVATPANVVGDFWTVVVVDATDAVLEAGSDANNGKVGNAVTISDDTPPTVGITAGPSNGAHLSTTEVTFEWAGADNVSPVDQLLFSYCYASVATDCDPSLGTFGTDTSGLLIDLNEADSPYVFKVIVQDEAGNVGPTPTQRTFTIDVTSPYITGHNPSGVVNEEVCSVRVVFNESVSGFAAGDVSLSGPGGAIAVTNVVFVGGVSYDIRFACQADPGVYDLSVGPNVQDAAGNVMDAAYAGSFTVALADLSPTDCDAPAEADAGQAFDLSWTVTNLGTSDALGTWTDKIYLSHNDVIGDDLEVGSFTQDGPLAPGATYTRGESIVVPADLAGTYWIVVATNVGGGSPEPGIGENNSWICGPILIADTQAPETTITAGPADGAYINTTGVAFQWRGTDNHSAAANLLYAYCLAPESVGCDPAAETFGTDTSAEFAGLSATSSPYTFKVVARDELGNTDPVPAERTFVVDLDAPFVAGHAPDGVVNDQVCAVRATFSESVQGVDAGDFVLTGPSGPIATEAAEEVSGDLWEFRFSCLTEAGAYSFTVGPVVSDLAGNPMADAYAGGFSIAIPDLLPTACAGPASQDAGADIEVSWTVTNQGTADAQGSWIDRVYLSEDAAPGGDIPVGAFAYDGPLAAGLSYSLAETVTVPNGLVGGYWIIVVTDTAGSVVEPGAENNNATACNAITINDTQPPATTIETGPADGASVSSTSVTFGWSGSDNGTPVGALEYSYCLAPTYFGCDPSGGPFSADTAETFTDLTEADSPYIFKVVARDDNGLVDVTPATRTFSVDQTGPEALNHSPTGEVHTRVCAVEITFNEPMIGFEPTDATLFGPAGVIPIVGTDALGEGDVWRFNFTCQSTPGDYSFTVGPNITDAAGNPLASAYAGGFHIELPDLVPLALDVPTNGLGGQQIEVSWTVENRGTVAAEGSWTDGFYLSTDQVWSGNDTLLAEIDRTDSLAVGASYSRTQAVTLPRFSAGEYWLIVVADSQEDVDEINEGTGNRLVSAGAVMVSLLPYPDLVIGEVAGPESAWAGQQITVCWTVTNQGDGGTEATFWDDDVYLSFNTAIGWRDAHLGRFGNSTSLGAGESYQQCQTVIIPSDAVGCYYLLVRADGTNHVLEYRTDLNAEANNDGGTAECADVTPPPPSDLQVLSVNAPASGWSGEPVTISWEVLNDGTTPTPVDGWFDAVYASEDEELNATDPRMCLVWHTGSLLPGESYTESTSCELPRWLEGPHYIFVRADSGNHVPEQGWEGNNNGYDPDPIMINLSPPPDLEVADLSVSGLKLPGSTIQVDWTVTNYGAGATEENRWYDAVYLSVDDDFGTTEDNTPLGDPYRHDGVLIAGGSYSRSVAVPLPDCHTDGAYSLFVVVDAKNDVEEYFDTYEENNDDMFVPVSLTFDMPDLEVSQVVVSSNGYSSQPVEVSWRVTNKGAGSTQGVAFADAIYLSTDAVWDAADDLLVTTFTHEAELATDDWYEETRQVILPAGVSGEYDLFVVADAEAAILECGTRENNAAHSADLITIEFTEADLVVTAIDVPSNGFSGQPAHVEWTVENAGNRSTDVGAWSDRVYLSNDTTLDLPSDDPQPDDPAPDVVLGTFAHAGALDAGQTYTRREDLELPPAILGIHYLIVCADWDEEVLEPAAEGNNCTASVAVPVNPTEPDLATSAVVGPASGQSGDVISVSWTVENVGEWVTAEDSWEDAIYLSADETFDVEDLLLGTVPHDGALAVGASYSAGGNVVLSAPASGTFYILVRADNADVVYEMDREDNNTAADPSGISVTCLEPDLVVSATQAPDVADSGMAIEVSWTVVNNGARATTGGGWTDAVYLSAEPALDTDTATLLGETSRYAGLGVAEQYTRNATVTLPHGISGAHYVFVVADSAGAVIECGADANNVSTPPETVVVGLTAVDLEVVLIDAPALGYVGQETTVSWRVTNHGASATPNHNWRDSVYLSLDTLVDPGIDPFLGFVERQDPVAAGVSYEASGTFVIPSLTIPAEYNVLVLTDSVNDIYEHEAEDNNTGTSPQKMTVGAPLPADLVVSNVVAPLSASPGLSADFAWTVTNQGVNDAVGSWSDSIYLSEDAEWNLSDPLVGKVVHTGTVAAGGGSYTGNANLIVPGVFPKPHYVIVRCDIHNQIPEGDGEANNTGVSAAASDIQITELELGVPFSAQWLAGATAHYYMVRTTPDETLHISVDADYADGATELYVRFGKLPDRGRSYDWAYQIPFIPDQAVTVPTTEDGTYYIMVYGDYVPNPPKPYTVLAESLPFGVTALTPSAGSNTGDVTVRISGARFERDTEFGLIALDETELTPVVVYPRDRSSAYATFDLDGVAAGQADATAANPGEFVTVAEELFEVIPGGGPQLSARIVAPSRVRAGRDFIIRIEYANIGTADIPAPLLRLACTRETLGMSLYPEGPFDELGSVRALGVNHDGPAGVLAPGAFGTIPVYVHGTGAGGLGMGITWLTGTQPINWAAEADRARPDGVSNLQWEAIWARVAGHVGDIWGGYEQRVAGIATRLWQEGELVYDVRRLFAEEIELAWELFPARISGAVLDGVTGEPLADLEVAARYDEDDDGEAEMLAYATTDSEGAFELRVSEGTYTLNVESYDVDPPVEVTLALDQDVRGLMLYAYVPVEPPDLPEPDPFQVTDQTPDLTRDADGNMHMVWTRDDEVWHAQLDGGAWSVTGQVAGAEGSDPRIDAGPPAEGVGAVTVAWRQNYANESEIAYAVGKPGMACSNGFCWSDPVFLTEDVYSDQLAAIVMTPAGELMAISLKKDASVSDDHDVYYSFQVVGPLVWPGDRSIPADSTTVPLRIDDTDLFTQQDAYLLGEEPFYGDGPLLSDGSRAHCFSWEFKNVRSFSVPVFGGKYGVDASVEACGSFDCDLKLSGELKGQCDLSKRVKVSVGGGASVSWKTNKKDCKYEFDSAKMGIDASGTVRFPVNDLPAGRIISVLGKFIGITWEVGMSVTGQFGGEVNWKAPNFPWPPAGGSGTWSIQGGPYGEVSFTDSIKAGVTGQVRIEGKWYAKPVSVTLDGVCITVKASAQAGPANYDWKYQYPEGCSVKGYDGGDPPKNAHVVRWYEPVPGGAKGDVALNELIITLDPLMGTGSVYPGQTVLADVTSDLTNDGSPAAARGASGEILAVWTKDAPNPNVQMGSSVVVAGYSGGGWSVPTELANADDFNSTPGLVFDSTGVPMVVWSTASAAGLDLSSPVDDVLNAMNASDLVYSRYVGGAWTAATSLASPAGSDENVDLAADGTGRVLAAWLHSEEATGDISVYASVWDGASWGSPLTVATAARVNSVAVEFLADGTGLVVWSADADGDLTATPEDLTIYHATYDGAWSAATALAKPEAKRATYGTSEPKYAPASTTRWPWNPPEECCGECTEDEDCDDHVDCTEDACVDYECKNEPRDSECEDNDACTEDKCDKDAGCSNDPIDCDDDDDCTEDTCDPADGCHNDDIDCDDNDICTEDTCDPSGGCQNDPLDCDDDDACTEDSCDPVDGCQHEDVDCDDSDVCTDDSCDPSSGCANDAVDCDDADACTEDTCDPVEGCAHEAVDCDDEDACTDDSCDVETGCIHETVECPDDGEFCNGEESCDSAEGCVSSGDPCPPASTCNEGEDKCDCDTDADCDDSDACTEDRCDEDAGCQNESIDCDDGDECTTDTCDAVEGCQHEDVECDDGDACNGVETCDPATGCVEGTPVDCDDGDECTVDNCDPDTGACDYEPLECDDDDVCNGVETCDPASGCVNGTPLDCDDGNECTTNTCDPVAGCQYEAVECDDGDVCNGVETCDPASGCVNGTPLDCDDHNECTEDNCDPQTGCQNTAINCDDGSACTSDSCDPASGCKNESIVCNDGSACTIDSCDPATGCVYEAKDCGTGDNCLAVWCDPSSGCKSRSLDCCEDCPDVTAPADPNEKHGPAGYGPERWVPAGDTMVYTILFENIPEATASAQVVTVTDQLPDDLDWRTFRVGNVGWGDKVVEIPDNRSFYQVDVDLVEALGVLVRVDAGINIQSGMAHWTLTAIDPDTGELTTDPDAGFLPPNNPEVHDGEGFVSFTVQPRRQVTTGTVIINAATIVFDVNEPIDTNLVSNTIDADPPSSNVLPLPDELPLSFDVGWTGADAEGGSGLGSFDIYVSEDGAPYELWITTDKTSATYESSVNRGTVSFFSVARDNAGNLEDAPELADAETVTISETVATAWSNSPICEGESIELFGKPTVGPSGPFTYAWTGPGGFSSDEPDPVVSGATAAMTGEYHLVVTNAAGIDLTTTVFVLVQARPSVDAGPAPTVCPDESAILSGSATDAGGLRWTTSGDGHFDNDSLLNTTYTPGTDDALAGSVELTLTADALAPCATPAVATTTVYVVPCMVADLKVGGLSAGVVSREVRFTLTTCGGEVNTRNQMVTFTAGLRSGVESVRLRNVPAGTAWLAVQEGHTLRTTVPVDLSATRFDTVDVPLTSGDLHTETAAQDNYVDLTDFAILAANWEQPIDPGEGTGGDVTGDGYQDAADFAVLQPVFFTAGDPADGCVQYSRGPRGAIAGPGLVVVSVDELLPTVAGAAAADLDRNGLIDARDVWAFVNRHGLTLDDEFERRLERLERRATEGERVPQPSRE